jgi:hypothetical protein
MNEKIESIIKLVGTDTSGKWMRIDNVEALAELIVQECVDVILEWESEPFPLDPKFGAKIIKEHFGIENR